MSYTIKPYRRHINYYETDQMQVVHHSNYARYLEESRFDLMLQAGIDYAQLEAKGIIIPVLELKCVYRLALKFDDTVLIMPRITKITPVRFCVSYEIRDAVTKELKHTAESSHCFVDGNFNPMNLKKAHPDVYQVFEDLVKTATYLDE